MGTISVGSIVVTNDSLNIDQLVDVTATAPSHNDVIMYNDSLIDVGFTDGWHSKPILMESLGNVETDTAPAHNEILAWNDFATDPAYPTGWVNKNILTIFTDLEPIVNSIVNVQKAILLAKDGQNGLTEQVMFTDTVAATGVINVALISCENNNALYKKEIVDSDFIFVQNLSAGVILNTTYTAGTFFRSDKGLTGFSGPVPVVLGPSSFALKEARFYNDSASATVTIVSMGTEISVSIYQGDGVTLESGPLILAGYAIGSLALTSIGEYFIQSTGYILCNIIEVGNTKMRNIPPMSSELIGWNRNCFISAQEATTTVTYHRRNNTTGTIAVSAGTSVDGSGTFGNNADFSAAGAIILRADNPISARTENDSAGTQAIALWPVDQLAQCFGIPATLDIDVDYGVSCIACASPYEGTASVYDNTGTLVTTFDFNRAGAISPPIVTTDQLFPASQRWKPADETVPANLVGGYVTTNVPAMVIMNMNGDAVWTGGVAAEFALTGSTPESLRAEIRLDADGFARRRDISNTGAVTWTVC